MLEKIINSVLHPCDPRVPPNYFKKIVNDSIKNMGTGTYDVTNFYNNIPHSLFDIVDTELHEKY